MDNIQAAVAAYLKQAVGVPADAGRAVVQDYPRLAVRAEQTSTVLLSGGALAEHQYQVTVFAADSRDREAISSLLSKVSLALLRGVPCTLGGAVRHLHPLEVKTEGERLTFRLEVCLPVPTGEEQTASQTMADLHLEV